MILRGFDEMEMRKGKPFFDPAHRVGDRKRIRENFGVGGDPHKAEDHNPGQGDILPPIQTLFPPGPGLDMAGSPEVVGVNQQINVGQNHAAPLS